MIQNDPRGAALLGAMDDLKNRLPVYRFAHTYTAMNLGETLIGLGHTNATAVQGEGGQPEIRFDPEFLAVISLSPQVAMNLCKALAETLQGYESMFGPVPQPRPPSTQN